jgi:hypothetical protein
MSIDASRACCINRRLSGMVADVLLLLFVLSVTGPLPAESSDRSNVVIFWNRVVLQAIRETRSAPTVSAFQLYRVVGTREQNLYGSKTEVSERCAFRLIRMTGGNFRLLTRLLTEIERVLNVNNLQVISSEVVEAARDSLVIGQS